MTYSSNSFTYNARERHFTADASDLTGSELFDWVPGINNAGVTVKSQRTGNLVRFMIVNRKVRDGYTLWWDLIPVHQDQVAFDIADVTMRIYND